MSEATFDTHPLQRLLSRRRLRVLGINSGTSIDGLDLALVEIRDRSPVPAVKCLLTCHVPLPPRLRRTLLRLAASTSIDKEEVARAHFALGDFMAASVRRLGLAGRRQPVDLIGSHGQTIGHFPAQTGGGTENATWQIGALNTIAQRTGIPTIGDFRPADIAAGGMGAPLSGYYHHIIFGSGVPVLNLGGIANVSVSFVRRQGLRVLAFDIGPANMMSDALAQRLLRRRFDRDGALAAAGRPIPAIVARALRLSYFRASPPKSCGREEFGQATVSRLFFRDGRPLGRTTDLLATAVEITAQAVAIAVTRWVAPRTRRRELVLTGGGVHNHTLVRRLSTLLPQWRLPDSSDRLIPPQFVEPVGFAVLAHETLRGRAGNLGGATGASRSAVLGLIALPAPR
ncbi:MAG: anhydro-N-acetylmuramic acid kinase [Candidatus Zixiibacteriota bacterium]